MNGWARCLTVSATPRPYPGEDNGRTPLASVTSINPLSGNVADAVKLHLAVAGIGKTGRSSRRPAVRHMVTVKSVLAIAMPLRALREWTFSDPFTHFGGHIGVFGRRAVVEIDVQHRHHFVGRAGQAVRRTVICRYRRFEVDAYRPGGVIVGGDEIIFSVGQPCSLSICPLGCSLYKCASDD